MMDDMALADELQASKNDATEWGDAEPAAAKQKSEKRKLAAMVSVRLAPDELAELQAFAKARGATVSGYLRQLALGHARGAAPAKPVAFSVVASTESSINFHSTAAAMVTSWGETSWTGVNAEPPVAV